MTIGGGMAGSALLRWLEDGRQWEGFPPTGEDAFADAEARVGVRFPADYRDLLLASDGGTLFGPKETITFTAVEDLADRNTDDLIVEAMPGMWAIGDNAGSGVYFYDPAGRLGRGEWALFWLDLGHADLASARFAGRDLGEVLRRIADGVGFFDEPEIGPTAL